MPNVSPSQAHESPLVRIHARFPDGQLHQMTISSTYRPTAEVHQSEEYRGVLSGSIRAFFAPRGVTVLRVDHVSAASVEVGGA